MTVHVLISGFVQGIGFRAFVKKNAIDLNLTGWVKNTTDGKVEAKFAGDKEKLDQIVVLCKKGPFLSEVKDLRADWKDNDEDFSSFDVIR